MFIREERWKLILRGIWNTTLITFMAVLLGTLLALGICLFRRTGSRLANIISSIYVKILQGIVLSPVAIRIIQLLFEETVMQNIVPHIDGQENGYPIRCLIEYSETDATTELTIDYGADSYNPVEEGNPLSAKLVKGIASRISHTFDSTNRLVLTI